jgi:hypothetical protein
LAVGILEGHTAESIGEIVSWEAGGARAISLIAGLAKRVVGLASCLSLIVEVASIAGSADTARG